ncbi:N-terminal EF-hand calcium-binding protein 3 isoform X1 [Delphinus delphis]|uniref:N-terminal EF-hand calcium-binding protein 3 isoform X1 n=1 Tax=Tursiops truncatus TaxID=9739 RepID=A0A6J3Q1B9_TURTR|nr:N-terminal EF-hand calcium-binding protein 3 isoform X1 [Tursiops truncatus]XP_059888739.1 N-terminal EF-hand calcium-binding protein 3 isoform X1 [Delphinus delphis]
MACAGLLTVCLIRPPAPEPPRPPAPAPAAGSAGHALFQDVFRRADKNDDGKLSFEEFQNYFADGVLSPGELRELFSSIDGHPADNLETEKLCDYFSEHLGVYRPVLAALESLNCAVLTAMDTTKLEYERASKVDQFVTRFLLRETVSQLQALQSSLEGASDTLEAQAHGPRSDEERVEVQSRPRGSRRAGRRALRSVSRSPTWSPGSSDTEAPSLRGPVPDPQGRAQRLRCTGGSRSTVSRSSSTSWNARPPGWNPCTKRSLPRGPTRTSSWPKGRCRWQRKPCRTSTMPCAATWTSQGPRAIACMCLPRRCWTVPPSPCTSSGRMRPPGEGTSSPPAVRPSSASSLTTCRLQTPSPLCSSQHPGGL